MIRVLVVDDETIAAEAHAKYLARLDGFSFAGIAHTARDARTQVDAARAAGTPIDLILLDLKLPDGDGLELARAFHTSHIPVDFIAITANRNASAVQAALGIGAIHYIIKPFGFSEFRDKLETYARYHHRLADGRQKTTQTDVDELVAARRPPHGSRLPKGLTAPTLDAVAGFLRIADGPVTANEAAEQLALSRVTARRYLEHLRNIGAAQRSQRYGTPGRPESTYVWRD